MAIKAGLNLDSDISTGVTDSDGKPVFTDNDGNVYCPDEEALKNYCFAEQDADLSKGENAGTVQKFFDFMAMHVFLPWVRALTVAFNRLKGDAKTTVAELEEKIGEGYDAIDERVQELEKNLESTESKVTEIDGECDAIDERVQKIEEEVVQSAEAATLNANEAADNANNAAGRANDIADNAIGLVNTAIDAAQSVRDDFNAGAIPALQEQNKKNGFLFWVGTQAEYEEQKDTIPENTLCIISDDTTEADILKAVAEMQAVKDEMQTIFNGIAGVSLGSGPIEVNVYEFDWFMARTREDEGQVDVTIVFDCVRKDRDALVVWATTYDHTYNGDKYELLFTHMDDGTYTVEATWTYENSDNGIESKTFELDELYGFKFPKG